MTSFVIGGVLPPSTRLRITWVENDATAYVAANPTVLTDSGSFPIVDADAGGYFIGGVTVIEPTVPAEWSETCGLDGVHNCGIVRFTEIDTTSYTLEQRTISNVSNASVVGLAYADFQEGDPFEALRIDGQAFVDDILELSFTLTREEQGDRGFIRLHTNTGERFEPYAPVEIDFNGDTHWFVIEQDMTLKLDTDLYEHRISIKDGISMFDSVYPPDRKFTRIQENATTVGEMLARYSGSGLEATPGLALYDIEIDPIYDTPMPQKEYVGANLSTIIKDIMRRIKSKPVLKNLDSAPLLTYMKLTERVGDTPIDDFDTWEYRHDEQSVASYATNALGKVKNAVLEDGRGMWYPSPTGYVGVRTEEFRLDEPDAAFIVDGRIWGVLEVRVKNAVRYKEPDVDVFLFEDLDISSWVVDTTTWLNLDNPTSVNFIDADPDNKNQANTIQYEIGGNKIQNLWDTFPGLGNREHLLGALLSAVAKFANDNPTLVQVSLNPLLEDWEDNAVARIRYVSQRDIDYMIEKMEVSGKFDTTMLSNQMNSLIELNQHADALSVLAERLGNDTVVFRKQFDISPYKLGNYTDDGYLISTIKYDVMGSRVYTEGELSKNYANIHAETAITREPYPFQVTTRNVQTNVITREYMEISETIKVLSGYANARTLNAVMNIFEYRVENNKQIYDAQIQPNVPLYITGANVGKAIHAPLLTYGGNAIVFHFRFTHPTYAGLTIEKDGAQRKRGAIPYVDDDNFLLSYRVRFGARSTWDETGNLKLYPLVNQTVSDSAEAEIGTNLGILVDVGLDPNCTLAHTHELLFVSDSDKIVLNGNLGLFNNLIQPYTSQPNIKVYASATDNDIFTHSDKKIRATDVHLNTATVEYATALRRLLITDVSVLPKNIAIVLDDEHILIAYNNPTQDSTTQALFLNNLLERQEKRKFPQ